MFNFKFMSIQNKEYHKPSKVIGILGSLQKSGNTKNALRIALNGAKEMGLSTELIELGKFQLPFCDGSFGKDNYPEDVWSWSELMRRLLGNADLFRYTPGEIPIQPHPTLIMAEIIAQVHQIIIL